MLFAEGMPPAVIDFSPYHRPADYAVAIIVVDALAWHAAPASMVDAITDVPHLGQLLRRAAIFRLGAADWQEAAQPGIARSHAERHRRGMTRPNW